MNITEVVDNIEEILVMEALTSDKRIQVKQFELLNKVLIYIDQEEYLSIRIDPIYYHLEARSVEAKNKLWKIGHKNTTMKTNNIKWVYAILRRMMK